MDLNDRPTDKGQDTLESLMANKVGITMEMAEKIMKGTWWS